MPETLLDLSGLSVLAVFAHPDDEGFGCGGALAMLVARGARVTLVCATNGDVGEISDPALATLETLARVRQEELRRAMAVTGIEDLRFLGYRDSGMAGAADNHHPESLHQAEPDRVVAQLAGIIREVRPEAVITHDPTGGYGHPDHIAVHQHVSRAFSLAGAPACTDLPGQGSPPWKPRLLYYVCFPRSNFRRMWQQMLDAGITPPFASLKVDTVGSPDEAVTTILDVSDFVGVKIASLECHRTQIDPKGPFSRLPPGFMREIMSTEYFTLAAPCGATAENDLLAGLV
jgi:LmbE family N-acetylglucosaminyl deacetylase